MPSKTKKALRKQMHARRGAIARARRETLSRSVAGFFDELAEILASAVIVSSYRPFGSELDPGPLEQRLRAAGTIVAFPRTPDAAGPLTFHAWHPGAPLERHRFGMMEPPAASPPVRPDALFVPLLAFDAAGNRLGYGGGYYDRTLLQLRETGGCRAIGLAFCEQEVDRVPTGAYDQSLDFVLTPSGMRKFGYSEK